MGVSETCGGTPEQMEAGKAYGREMAFASLLYAGALIGCVYVARHLVLPQWASAALAISPVAPVLLMLRAYLRFLNRVDEFQRRIQTEAMLAAAGIVGFACLTYGFLEAFAGFPAIPGALLFVFPAMIGVWGVAQVFVRKRYQ